MKAAFGRLLLISLVAISLGFLALFALRFLGLQTQPPQARHPLLDTSPLVIAKPPKETKDMATHNLWLEEILKKKDLIPWLDFRRTKDNQWVFYPQEFVVKEGVPWPLSQFDFEELKNQISADHLITLPEILARTPGQALLLNFIEKDPYWVKNINETIPDSENERIIVRSPIYNFGYSLRKAQPAWLYASDPSSVARFLFMAGLWLEPMSDFWPDIFLSEPKIEGRDVFAKRVQEELARRKTPIIIVASSKESLPLLQREVLLQGLVVSEPAKAAEFLKDLGRGERSSSTAE